MAHKHPEQISNYQCTRINIIFLVKCYLAMPILYPILAPISLLVHVSQYDRQFNKFYWSMFGIGRHINKLQRISNRANSIDSTPL